MADPAPQDEQPTTEERVRVELTRSEAESLFGGLRYMTCAPSAVERQAIRKSARGKLTAALTPDSEPESERTPVETDRESDKNNKAQEIVWRLERECIALRERAERAEAKLGA